MKVNSYAYCQGQVGHTHNEDDQLFVCYNKLRHGLVPIRPHVILCNGITLKPSMYTMLIGSDESDA